MLAQLMFPGKKLKYFKNSNKKLFSSLLKTRNSSYTSDMMILIKPDMMSQFSASLQSMPVSLLNSLTIIIKW